MKGSEVINATIIDLQRPHESLLGQFLYRRFSRRKSVCMLRPYFSYVLLPQMVSLKTGKRYIIENYSSNDYFENKVRPEMDSYAA